MDAPTWELFPKACGFSCSKGMRERGSWNQTWAKFQWKTESKVLQESVRGSEWEKWSVSETQPSRPQFIELRLQTVVASHTTTASSCWRRPAACSSQVGSADPLWARWLTGRAHMLPTVERFQCLGAGFKLCFERCSNKIFIGFYAREIFCVFIKIEMRLEKSQHAEKWFWKFKHVGEFIFKFKYALGQFKYTFFACKVFGKF